MDGWMDGCEHLCLVKAKVRPRPTPKVKKGVISAHSFSQDTEESFPPFVLY